MKKTLLLTSCLVAGGFAAMAATPTPKVYENVGFRAISPDGHYAISEVDGLVTIFDFVNEDSFVYGEETLSYAAGLGNSVSNIGIVLGSTSHSLDAAYWEDGEWKELPVPNPEHSNMTNGITPDGSRICGSIGMAPISIQDDNLMLAPAYWDRNADGTYSEAKPLPYPETDIAGRVPQYVTAITISEDGKTISGMVTDCTGMVVYPIVYLQKEDGSWEYKLPLGDLFAIDSELPEFPGDGPAEPQVEDFMSPEALEEYNAAIEAWQLSGYTLPYPDKNDYLTDEQLAAYDEAMEEFYVEYDEWASKAELYYDTFYDHLETVPQFEFNTVYMSPDGKRYITSSIKEDDSDPYAWWPASIYTPWAIDIETDEIKAYDFGKSMAVCYVPNNDVILAFNGLYEIPETGYVLEGDSCTDLRDYLLAKDPGLKDWMDENLVHEMSTYDEDFNEVLEEYTFTGLTIASADMGRILFYNTADWDYYMQTCGYEISFETEGAGVDTVAAANKAEVSFDEAGNLTLGADVVSVEVYDLSGRQVLSTSGNGKVANTLARGVYVVKALNADGTASATKLAK